MDDNRSMEDIILDILNENDDKTKNKSKNCFSVASIEVSSEAKNSNAEVIKAIESFSPTDGWFSRQSLKGAKRISPKAWFSKIKITDEDCGYILSGEFFNEKKNESLAVRYDGEKWNLVFITTSKNKIEEKLIKQTKKQLSKLSDNKHTVYINYDVYYKFESEYGYRPYCSAFTGFTEEKI